MSGQIITVKYNKSFEKMMIDAGVPRYQIDKIFTQLGYKELAFPHEGTVYFEVQDFTFNEATLSRAAKDYICGHDTDAKWESFDVEHLLADFTNCPRKFKTNFCFATRRTFEVDGVPHIFVMTITNGNADLELLRDDHAWSPHTSIFSGQRTVRS
jgi:hypothetical protein